MSSKSKRGSPKDELRVPRITSEVLRRGVMGKYYGQVIAGGRTITLAGDVAKAFPNESDVNEALRLVQKMREIGKPHKQRKSA